jgi:hypothetical protein
MGRSSDGMTGKVAGVRCLAFSARCSPRFAWIVVTAGGARATTEFRPWPCCSCGSRAELKAIPMTAASTTHKGARSSVKSPAVLLRCTSIPGYQNIKESSCFLGHGGHGGHGYLEPSFFGDEISTQLFCGLFGENRSAAGQCSVGHPLAR